MTARQRAIPPPTRASAREIGEALGLKINSVYRLVREGRLAAKFVGAPGSPMTGFLVEPGAIDDFLARRASEGEARRARREEAKRVRAKRQREARQEKALARLGKLLVKVEAQLATLQALA